MFRNCNFDFVTPRRQTCPEPDPDFRFTKMLPRKSESYTGRDYSIVCQVNDHRAPVRWFKGEQELPENKFERFLVTKDFIGNCKLTVIDPRKEDSAVYKCIIDGTKSVTKGAVKFEGRDKESGGGGGGVAAAEADATPKKLLLRSLF